MPQYDLLGHIKTASIFSLLGVLLFGLVFLVMVKVAPVSSVVLSVPARAPSPRRWISRAICRGLSKSAPCTTGTTKP